MKRLFFLTLLVIAFASVSSANDSPHANDVVCDYCHSASGTGGPAPSPFWGNHIPSNIEDTSMNLLCTGCHDQLVQGAPPSPTTAMSVRTHTSRATRGNNDYGWGSGQFTVECVACHNPHYQRQYVYFRNLAPIKLAQGTVNTIAYDAGESATYGIPVSRITFTLNVPGSKAAWTDPATWVAKSVGNRGAIIYPNSANVNYSFSVLEKVDATTILIRGDVTTGLGTTALGVGKTFMVTYGQAVKEKIFAPGKTSSTTFRGPTAGDGIAGPLTGSPVKFFDKTLTNSFALNDLGGDTDTTKDGICQVCHTQTAYWRSDGSRANHNSGANCMTCHPHSEGFKASCSACHGFPPVDSETLVSNPSPTTGSTTAGAHAKHATGGSNYSYACGTCHSNGMPATPVSGNNKIQIGFNLFGRSGGSYGGQTLTPPYSYEGTNGTTIAGASKTCSNIYCHGNYPGSGKNASPKWGSMASGVCGTCHSASNTAPPASGKHGAHTDLAYYGFACTLCHKEIVSWTSQSSYTISDKNRHVNGYVDYKFDPADFRVADGTYSVATGSSTPSNGATPRSFGTCSTIYCHSNVQPEGGIGKPSIYSNPSWTSGTAPCGSCHAGGHGALIASGSHTAHLAHTFTTSDFYKCVICHTYEQSTSLGCSSCHNFYTTTEYAKHANYQIDMAFDPTFSAGGSATYNGTPEPGDGYRNCSNTYCHGNGTSVASGNVPPNTSPAWGSSGTLVCSSCHGYPPGYANGAPKANAHSSHSSRSCDTCHYSTTTDGTSVTSKVNHVNRQYDVVPRTGTSFTYAFSTTGGSCSNSYCHSTGQGISDPTQQPSFTTPTWGNPSSGACGTCHNLGSHTGGWGTPMSTGSHTAHFLYDYSFGTSPSNCQVCHYVNITGNTCSLCHPDGSAYDDRNAYSRNAANHVNNLIDVDFLAAITGSTATYSGDRTPGTSFGSCSNIYCHSDGTSRSTWVIPANTSPVWGTVGTLACNACHGFPPIYPSGSPKANSHARHSSYTCAQCHSTTTLNGTSITNYRNHVDLSYDVYPQTGKYFSYSFSPLGGTCSNISCHGNSSAEWGSPASYDCVDVDGDGICADDNCPTMANPGQEDANGNGIGDICDAWLSVSAGQSFSLARRADGSLYAWGYGESGNLGDGMQESRLMPVQSGPDTDWTSSAGGLFHTVALKSDNTLWAWGVNAFGQMGTGTSYSLSPAQVGSESSWLAVKAGEYHTVAIKTDGTLWTWGRNSYGQLGLGDSLIVKKLSPTQVGSDTGWTHVAAGAGFSLAIKSGTLWAWGQNSSGQLGDGSTTQRYAPVQIGSDTDWIMVAAGANHGLALKSNGQLWAWGYNGSGQLGDGTLTRRLAPVRIGADTDWTSIAGGYWHTLALKTNQTLWSWGGNASGQLGDNTTTDNRIPRQVGSNTTWVTIAAGNAHSLALRSDGSLWTWGYNSDGQVGDGTRINRLTPAQLY